MKATFLFSLTVLCVGKLSAADPLSPVEEETKILEQSPDDAADLPDAARDATNHYCHVGVGQRFDETDYPSTECLPQMDACLTKIEEHGRRYTVTKTCTSSETCSDHEDNDEDDCATSGGGDDPNRSCFYCCESSNCNFFEFVPVANHDETLFFFRDGSQLSFDRDLDDYAHGFGNTQNEFFLGLEYLNEVTTYYSDCTVTACYDSCDSIYFGFHGFTVDNADNNYKARFTSLTKMGHVHRYHFFDFQRRLSVSFFTYDSDSNGGCAASNDGGWWYSSNCNEGPTISPYSRYGGHTPLRMYIDCGTPK